MDNYPIWNKTQEAIYQNEYKALRRVKVGSLICHMPIIVIMKLSKISKAYQKNKQNSGSEHFQILQNHTRKWIVEGKINMSLLITYETCLVMYKGRENIGEKVLNIGGSRVGRIQDLVFRLLKQCSCFGINMIL